MHYDIDLPLVTSSYARRQLGTVLRRFARVIRRYPLACVGATFIVVCLFAALFATTVAPHDPYAPASAAGTLTAPSSTHWMGTDEIGRDTFSRVLLASRVSLQVGLFSVGCAVLAGIPIGLISAYAGGVTDSVIVAIIDGIIAFPGLIFALALVATFGPGISQVIAAISIATVPIYARIIRSQALSISAQDYVLAARSLGASQARILRHHVLPNSVSPLIVQASLGLAGAVLAEAGLSFLGVGVRPPQPTWGNMLQSGFEHIHRSVWLSVFPGVAIFLLVLSCNFIGDSLRDSLDPKLRNR
jgi:peptide/nickel transport system permease protein